MIYCKWKTFSSDIHTYTQEDFERIIEDDFEAMKFDEDKDFPSIIWTTNYVCLIKDNARMIKDLSFTKILRNPVCER